MKVFIDKHGGYHYHKAGCKIMDVKHPHSEYEEIEHQIRAYGYPERRFADIKIDGKYYRPCPFCWGYESRNK